MSTKDKFKLPRLYCSQDLHVGGNVKLDGDKVHYLRNVMRVASGDCVRLFNAKDGEFLCEVSEISKKSSSLNILENLRQADQTAPQIHLYFAPLKKQRMDQMIEKATELGVTYFRAFASEYSDIHKIKPERIRAQILEASEQCERLDIPEIDDRLVPLKNMMNDLPDDIAVYAALERADARAIHDVHITSPCAFIIGPVGGFSDEEKKYLADHERVKSLSLGPRVLRCETAALFCLSHVR